MPLKAHFLNVGQGDCTIIEFPSGRVAMIDIDNLRCLDNDTREELLSEYHDSIEYLTKRLRGTPAHLLDAEYLTKEEHELTDPLAYYDTHIGAYKDLFRLIITHPDMDHMTGLHRLVTQDSRKQALNSWHIGPHDFNLAGVTASEWETCPYDLRDWNT